MSLHDLSYRGGKLQYRSRHATEPEWVLEDYLRQARRIVDEAVAAAPGLTLADELPQTDDFEHLRWFHTPHEALAELKGQTLPKGDAVLFPGE